ncbi:GNAT family N-acetyltransferase [Xenorhabdus lircayensis]|uniref:GNAT family N-acetyltransferase n=1 Tax=Xenorhabdus lircayensis TaxID=2763499 RepID=A0ABS0U447_9GAMM|nr:GNAT family N-acetyltransferase [Xenorhabdus lircayensis]
MIPEYIEKLNVLDFSFTVAAALIAPFSDKSIEKIEPINPPYTKNYGFDNNDIWSYLMAKNQALLIAESIDRESIGYLAISEHWNNLASIDDIAVDIDHRGSGVAKSLMDAAVKWAVDLKLAGIRLETQSNNVTACRFYARYGFKLEGYDRYLYSALNFQNNEIVLFWYLIFADT